jgi:hypothetical protein
MKPKGSLVGPSSESAGGPSFSSFKLHLLSVLAGAMCLLLPAAAGAVTVVISSARDTAIFAENADYNLGAGNLIAGTNAFGGDDARSLLAFDIAAAIPAGSIVSSVTFQVGVIRQSNRANPSSYELHRLLKDWSEGSGGANVNTGSPALAGETTWNSQFHGTAPWSAPGGQAGTDYVPIVSGTGPVINDANTVYQIDSTSILVADVQAWLDDPSINDGWMFLSSSEGVSGTARRFSSMEVPGGGIASAQTPRIIVDFAVAPEPSRAVMMFAAALSTTLLRRRQ